MPRAPLILCLVVAAVTAAAIIGIILTPGALSAL